MDHDRPHGLRVEHLVAPLGIGPEPPRLSWQLPEGADHQVAYQLLVTVDDPTGFGGETSDTGRVESPEHLWVPSGVEPVSGRRVTWRVKVWTDLGESEWSAPSWWEHGLLSPEDWTAHWVAPVEAEDRPARQRPVHQLAGAVEVPDGVVRARLHATAHGLYEAFLDGERVGDAELTPGWTAYRSRLAVQTYDVTDLVHPGTNVLGVLLSDGWWRGQNSVARRVDDYGATTAVLAQLVITLATGENLVAGTDGTWRCTPSHILGADPVAGEVWDLRRRAAWADWSAWQPVRVEDHGFDLLVASPAPAVRRIEELDPASVRELSPGRAVVDLGQNINGWVRLRSLGPAGTTLTLTHGEWLDEAGDVTQAHVDDPQSAEIDRSIPFQADTVTSAGEAGDVFEPRHSTKGFQYVRVEGHPGPLGADDLTGVVVHTDLEARGGFACSDPRLEAVHRLAEWSFRDNACDIPTDCPTRERAGWTGDWQIYVDTAAFLYDVGGFSVKWLRDLAADQRPDGKVPNLVPESHPGDDRPPSFWPGMEGSAGWGDAAVHVPWVIHRVTGDVRLLEEQWASMTSWVDWAAGVAATERHHSRVERSAEAAPHEQFLWDTGWHFGEWLEAGETLEASVFAAMVADPGPVATAYLHRSAAELAEIAGILGRPDDARRYGELAAGVADAWRTEFLAADGTVTPHTQAGYTRALAFGLVPEALRPVAVDHLVALVREAGTHLATGFLSTPFLLPVLADHGHLELAYELLHSEGVPGWMVMVDRGATTVWEEWEGVDAKGRPHASLNHYSKGAVIGFLHRCTAGIELVEPGYRRFRVRPRPGGGLSWAAAHHDSPHGRIESRWEALDGDPAGGSGYEVTVTVPPGTRCELVLPDGSVEELGVGTHSRRSGPVPPRPVLL